MNCSSCILQVPPVPMAAITRASRPRTPSLPAPPQAQSAQQAKACWQMANAYNMAAGLRDAHVPRPRAVALIRSEWPRLPTVRSIVADVYTRAALLRFHNGAYLHALVYRACVAPTARNWWPLQHAGPYPTRTSPPVPPTPAGHLGNLS